MEEKAEGSARRENAGRAEIGFRKRGRDSMITRHVTAYFLSTFF